jgi:hypothetical protein
MEAGEIRILTLQLGDIDLTDQSKINYSVVEIYEDIFSPTGPFAEINVVDSSDLLGKTNLNGSYDKDVNISFSLDGSASANFKFKMMENKDLSDGSTDKIGSGHNKTYKIRCCSPEMLNAQGNYVQKSYDQQTSKIVEDIVKNNFKSNKSIDAESTYGSRRLVFSNKHPIEAIKILNSEHVSDQHKSSAFVLFQQSDNGSQKYVFCTFEKLFEQSSTVTLKQSADLAFSNISNSNKANSIIWIKIPNSFFTPTRSLSKSQQNSYDPTTGTADEVDQKKQNYSLAGKQIYDDTSYPKAVPVHTMNDAINNKSSTKIAEARKNRVDFLSHLSQTHGTLEVYGNPNIKLGSIVNLDIPNKSDGNTSAGEKQFNGKALVVSIRHKIRPVGQTPRYTMILGVVTGGYKEGGGGNG